MLLIRVKLEHNKKLEFILFTMTLSKSAIYKAASNVGVSKALIKRVLPSWWEDSLLETSSGFAQFVFLLRHRLGLQFESTGDGVKFHLLPQKRQFKVGSGAEVEKLVRSSLLLGAFARTLIRVFEYNELPLELERLVKNLSETKLLTLDDALLFCRQANLPVLYMSSIPSNMARPAGTVFKFRDHFAVILSHKHKIPSAQLFILLHEIGHIVNGHLENGESITDLSISRLAETLRDEVDEQEIEADQFALDCLRCGVPLNEIISSSTLPSSPSQLAVAAQNVAKKYGVPAGHYILSYGREVSDWRIAQQALKFIETPDALDILYSHNLEQYRSLEVKVDDLDLLEGVLS